MSLKIEHSVVVTGSVVRTNDYYIDYYKKENNIDVRHFLEDILGRKTRYVCNEFENTLTLASDAVDKLIKETGIEVKDIGAIIVASQFPEFTVPTQSCLIHEHIKANSRCFTLDINANCLGMVRGLDVLNRYLSAKDTSKYAILIGADSMYTHTQKPEAALYANVGDAGCALLLSYNKDEIGSGVIGCSERILSSDANNSLFPECGMSNIVKYTGDATKVSWITPELEPIMDAMRDSLYDVLEKHHLTTDDIDWYCGSQFSKALFDGARNKCNIPEEKGIYIGYDYGYTGTSSPIVAFHEGVKSGKIKSGDLVFFTTVGIGHIISSMLLRV